MKRLLTAFLIISFTGFYAFGQTETTIAEIQGTGFQSPLLNDQTTLRSVVITAIHRDLMFVQSTTPDDDSRSSEGIRVEWEDADDFKVSDIVDITGIAREVDNVTTIEAVDINFIGENNNSIIPLALDNDFPGPTRENINRLENVESQLVSFTNLSITGPSDGGNLAYISPSDLRPMREPGIESPGISDLPEWDGNPEVFFFNPTGLGLASNAFLNANMKITGTGIVVEDEFNYALLPISYIVVEDAQLPDVVTPMSTEFNVGCLNTLFLEEEDGSYELRLQKVARYIIDQLGTPDVVALQEVGGTQEFIDLAAVLSELTGFEYRGLSQNATGSINNGYLVRNTFTVTNLVAQGTSLSFEGGRLHDRPPLLLDGFINTETGSVPFSILNLHSRSLSGIEGANSGFVRGKRQAQAISVSQMVQILQGQNKEFLVVGDYNAFQFSDGYVDVVNQIAGTPSLGALLEIQAQGINPLTNVSTTFTSADEQYSFVFRGNAQILDHCLASEFTDFELSHFHYGRGNSDYPNSYLEQDSPFRASDHDGFAVYLEMDSDIIVGNPFTTADFEINIPNPFTEESSISFQLDQKQNVSLDLFNLAGQLMYSASLGALENDKVELPFFQTFNSGIYILKINGKTIDFTKKLVLIK